MMTIAEIRRALSGRAKYLTDGAHDELVMRGFSTDSRRVQPDEVFVALKGESFDAHDFIEDVYKKGVRVFLCNRYPSSVPSFDTIIFLVEDVQECYRQVASYWRDKLEGTVIAVAGSVGKTTTKDLLHALLQGRFSDATKTQGSQNGFVGLPMTLLAVPKGCSASVIEVGIDAPGAMQKHIELVRPDMAVVTAISEEHLEWLIDLETVAREESLILEETARSGGMVFVNRDDQFLSPWYQTLSKYRTIGFSLEEQATPTSLRGKVKGNMIQFEGLGQKSFELPLPLPGKHNALNLAGAVAVGISLGLTPNEMRQGLESFKASGGRSDLVTLHSGTKVLCDFYNANPASMNAAFAVAKDLMTHSGEVYLCLGDMKELGTQERQLHESLGESIAQTFSKAKVFLMGERMIWLKDRLDQLKNQNLHVSHFASHEELAKTLKAQLSSNDVVVIKGSRSMQMEKVWKLIS